MAVEKELEDRPGLLARYRTPPYLGAAIIIGPYLVLAVLSAAQIYYGLSDAGRNPSWWRQIWTNLLAWAPWPIMAPMVARVWRDRPLTAGTWLPRGSFHLVGSFLTTLIFLVYLTLFRFAFFDSLTGPLSLESFIDRLGREAGQFFVPAWVIYWVIGMVGFAWYRSRGDDGTTRESESDVTAAGEGSRGPIEERPELRRIEIRSVGRTRWIDLDQIEWIEADGIYAVLHTGERSHAYRETMKSLEKKLAPSGFVRIHRSAIVNGSRVTEIRPASHGDAELRLEGGQTLKVSRTYRGGLDRTLEHLSRADPAARSGSQHP